MTSDLINSLKKENAGLQSQAGDLASQLVDFTKTKTALSERIKELECLNNLFRLASNKVQSMDHFLQSVVNLLPSGFQAPEFTCCKITYEGLTFISESSCESSICLSAPIIINEKTAQLQEHVQELEQFFEATIEREFRMEELRQELAALKNNLGQ